MVNVVFDIYTNILESILILNWIWRSHGGNYEDDVFSEWTPSSLV
jgi:hypothetical protein